MSIETRALLSTILTVARMEPLATLKIRLPRHSGEPGLHLRALLRFGLLVLHREPVIPAGCRTELPRERETQRERERERERDSETDRQADRQTDGEKEGEIRGQCLVVMYRRHYLLWT